MKNVLRSFLACLTLALLTACGNKGPLVLPEKPAAEAPAETPAAPAVESPASGDAGPPARQR